MHAPAHSQSFDQSTPTPISEKKLAANRANAQKSTGPKTNDGKSNSSQNALEHGAFAQATLLPNEDPAPFKLFRNDWLKTFSPQTTPMFFLTERAVGLAWRLQRLAQTDTALHFTAQTIFAEAREKQKTDPSYFSTPNSAGTCAVAHPQTEKLRNEPTVTGQSSLDPFG